MMTPRHDDDSKWMIRAVVPIQKTGNTHINSMTADLNLLDGNGMKVREGFSLSADDLESLIPVFNAAPEMEKTIVFSAGENMKKDFSYKEAAALIDKVKKVSLTINMNQPGTTGSTESAVNAESPEVTPAADPEKPVTLNSLLTDYGIYGMLAQYEKYLKKGDKKRAKQLEDKLYSIERKVKNDPSIPYSLRERFVDYIENKEDEIEDRY